MNPLLLDWDCQRVPIGSRGGSNTCWKIGPIQACVYDDWKQREAGFSEEDIALAARAIKLVPDMVAVLNQIRRGDIWYVRRELEAIFALLYLGEDE